MLKASCKRSGCKRARLPQLHLLLAFVMVGSKRAYSKLNFRRQSVFITAPSHFQDHYQERGRCPAYRITNYYRLLLDFTPLFGYCFLTPPGFGVPRVCRLISRNELFKWLFIIWSSRMSPCTVVYIFFIILMELGGVICHCHIIFRVQFLVVLPFIPSCPLWVRLTPFL